MTKVRIYELAKELGVDNKVVVDKAKELGFDVKSHMSSLEDTQEKALQTALSKKNPAKKPAASKAAATTKVEKPAQKTTPAAKPATDKPIAAAKPGEKAKIKISAKSVRHPQTNTQSQGNRPRNNNNNNQRNNQNGQGQNRNNNQNGQNRNNNQNRQGQNRNNNQNNYRGNRPNNDQPKVPARINAAAHLEQYKELQREDERVAKQRQEARSQRPANARPKTNKPNTNKPTTSASKSNTTRPANEARPNTRPNNTRPNVAPVTAPSAAKPATETRKKNFRNSDKPAFRKQDWSRKRKNNNNRKRETIVKKKEMPQRKDRPLPEVLIFSEGMNAQDLGKLLHREPAEIVKKLFMLGVMINQNQSLDKDTIELVAEDYGIKAEEKIEEDISDIDTFFEEEIKSTENQVNRPPVVTIMGHVDHGKTTLLDQLRNSHVTEGEAGGITQHIGAYQVKLDDRLITFLDTPGHAAFTNMRARGADITDIIILVVAADDGVMPQTIEAINHAKAAGAPLIVAVNKIDKPDANPNHVMEQLMEYGLVPEEWGGETIFVKISAKQGSNIDELLQMVLLQADVLELKANPDQKAIGTVIEARLDKGKGPVASLLVQQGTLHVGDPIVVGNTFGRVRVMTNDRGRRVKFALPSEPVEITGLNDVPDSADKFVVFDDEKTARAAGEERAKKALIKDRNNTHHVTLDNLFDTMKQGELKEVNVIIKADVQGSAEALGGSLEKIEVEGVRVNIIHSAVGAINESDITLASASNAILIGFNVRPTPQAKIQADTEKVDIRLHSVIYKVIDEIEAAMKGMLEPTFEEKVTGSAIIRETFKVSKLGTIAGIFVTTGYIERNSGVRLIRNGIVIYDGKLASLKRFKDDVKEVKSGFDGGLMIENYNDIKIDDEIEAYVMQEVPVE